MERFESEVKAHSQLFDEDDLERIQTTLQERKQEVSVLTQRFKLALDLYQTTVCDLEIKIKKRQSVLEQLDASTGAVSEEPSLLQHFGKKQAIYATSVIEARKLLCSKIREILGSST